MIEVLPSCHFSAKRHRPDCLYLLIVYKAKDKTKSKRVEIICSFLTEIILALKEVNKKTRNRAYDVLVQIGRAFENEDNSGKKGRLHQFFDMVAGCLVGETPHMISAAVKCLARLTYEFSDLLSASYQVLPLSFLLLQGKNEEIIKATLGLLKVLVAKSQSENLHNHLNVMVEGLLKWPCETKNHFKAKFNMQSSDQDSDDDDERSEVASFVSKKSNKGQKRRKTSEFGWAYTGKEYASKKARGDLKKKGKLEPYAYWPLDRKMLSRRPEHRASARRGMASVVKMTKRLEGKSVASALADKGSKSEKVHKKR